VDRHLVLRAGDAAYAGRVNSRGGHRVARATAATAITLPCVLLAHLLTAGVVASATATALSALLVLAVTVVLPARSRTGLALVAGAGQLCAHAALALQPAANGSGTGAIGCLPAVGRGAEFGLRLAVLRADGGCPAGTLAPGASLTGALAAITTAVVILLGHAAVAALTGVLLAAAEAVATRAAALRSAALLVLRRPPLWLPVSEVAAAAPAARRWFRSRPHPAPLLRRGPPAAVGAPS
jgi:hypothetical protein